MHDEMWLKPKSTLRTAWVTSPNGLPGSPARMPRALIGAPGTFRNLSTSAETSVMFGWIVASGGLYGLCTSPQRVVLIDSGADTAAQLASTPAQLAARFSTPYTELGVMALPVTCSSPTVLQT